MIKLFKLLPLLLIFCANLTKAQIKVGAESINEYSNLIKDKRVAVVVNQTSVINNKLLLDTLISLKINIVRIFTPEHGIAGNTSAGVKVDNSFYGKNRIPVISLYGNKVKPSLEDMKGLDVVIFDIQDVGVRFFTYISTLTYIMEACAESNLPLIVLDRPDPNGHYVDGPVLEKEFSSFVGLHPVPVVYGMTIGEYALMVNGEGWLKNNAKCNLTVIKLKGYNHNKIVVLPIPPSPNLRTKESVWLYPSLCFFEGTDVSVGRGTDRPFEIIGKPGFMEGNYTFTPVAKPGIADNPLYKDKECKGFDLKGFCANYLISYRHLYLYWLKGFYDSRGTKFCAPTSKDTFFNDFFDKLAGTDKLRHQIIDGISVENIQRSWIPDLEKFKTVRKKYLLYSDFK